MGSSSSDQNTLQHLSNEIVNGVTELVAQLKKDGSKLPTHGATSTFELPECKSQNPEIQKSRYAILDSLMELQRIVLGPSEYIKTLLNHSPLDIGALRAIVNLNIQHAVPMQESISFSNLARETKIDEDLLTRILRYSVSIGIFSESPVGHVRQTPTSRALTQEALSNMVKWCADVQVLSDLRLYEAMDPSRPSSAIPKVPFNIAHDTPLGMWDYHAKDKHLQDLFSANVATEFGSAEMSPEHLTMGYSWDQLGSGTIIDVGGSSGHVSKAIARLYPNLHFIVQDLPDTIDVAKSDIPTDLNGQVTFQGHDFFTPQDTAADAYFFRYILHNWAEDDAVRIIQNLKPKLKNGSRLLVNEYVSNADAATASMEDKIYRERDVQMFALLNSKERTVEDYQRIVAQAEPGFKFCGITMAPGHGMVLLEWAYKE